MWVQMERTKCRHTLFWFLLRVRSASIYFRTGWLISSSIERRYARKCSDGNCTCETCVGVCGWVWQFVRSVARELCTVAWVKVPALPSGLTGEAKRDARSAGMDLHTPHRVVCYSLPSFEPRSCQVLPHTHIHPRRA
ncbi:unnamed protein product, partial [Ectocarpus fasciculatus]